MLFYSVSQKLVVGLSYKIGQTYPSYWSDQLGDPNWLGALCEVNLLF
jgi:hypothetical protein